MIVFGVFAALTIHPSLVVLVVCQVVYRAARFALAKPARETLFTLVTTEQRYQAKPVLDTLVYRGGDVGNSWFYEGLRDLTTRVSALPANLIPAVMLPMAVVWGVLALALGREQARRSAADASPKAMREEV